MKSSEDWISDLYDNPEYWEGGKYSTTFTYEGVRFLLNEARKEAIIECAEKAKIVTTHTARDPRIITGYSVDKESILSLINELK